MEALTILGWMPSGGETILILLAILLLFGAKRIPDLARSLGKSLSEFKKGKDEGASGSSDSDKPKTPDSDQK